MADYFLPQSLAQKETCRECSARIINGNLCGVAGLENKTGERPTRKSASEAHVNISAIPDPCGNGYGDLASGEGTSATS